MVGLKEFSLKMREYFKFLLKPISESNSSQTLYDPESRSNKISEQDKPASG